MESITNKFLKKLDNAARWVERCDDNMISLEDARNILEDFEIELLNELGRDATKLYMHEDKNKS